MDQYDRFLSKENFMLAFLRIKTMRRNEYKEFYYKDISAFEAFLDANINQLINDIKENKYQPRPVCKYYVPKNKNLARPFSLLGFIDLIVYQAICNIVHMTIEKALLMFLFLGIFQLKQIQKMLSLHIQNGKTSGMHLRKQ